MHMGFIAFVTLSLIIHVMYNIATVTQLTALARLATRIVYAYYRSLLMNDKTETMRPARTV